VGETYSLANEIHYVNVEQVKKIEVAVIVVEQRGSMKSRAATVLRCGKSELAASAVPGP
jgi:hypothetical protein